MATKILKLEPYITKIAKQENKTLSDLDFIEKFIENLIANVGKGSNGILEKFNKKTIDVNVIDAVFSVILDKDIYEFASIKAQTHLNHYIKYQKNKKTNKGKNSTEKICDLTLSVSRIRRYFEHYLELNFPHFIYNLSNNAMIILTSIIEYLLIEIFSEISEKTISKEIFITFISSKNDLSFGLYSFLPRY